MVHPDPQYLLCSPSLSSEVFHRDISLAFHELFYNYLSCHFSIKGGNLFTLVNILIQLKRNQLGVEQI